MKRDSNGEEVLDLAKRIAAGWGRLLLNRGADSRNAPSTRACKHITETLEFQGYTRCYRYSSPVPVLLVSDTVGSRWSFTDATFVLRDTGSGPVLPLRACGAEPMVTTWNLHQVVSAKNNRLVASLPT